MNQNGDTYTYQYGDQNKLEAVYLKKKEETTPKLYLKYAYDANGNTIERIAYTAMGEEKTVFEYDTLNRVIETDESGMITQYLYDNAGNRFLKDTPGGITLYLRHGQTAVAMDIEVPETVTDIRGKVNRYVLSGDLLAGRITKEIKADGSNTVSISYYHLDHLNSTKCVSNEAGEVEVRYIYRAFGSQLAKIGSGDAKYTYSGKELDEENGLYYFNARYYDAEVGRFISVDPAQDGWNWYGYCNNNPLSFKDPTGLEVISTKTVPINVKYTDPETHKVVTGVGATATTTWTITNVTNKDGSQSNILQRTTTTVINNNAAGEQFATNLRSADNGVKAVTGFASGVVLDLTLPEVGVPAEIAKIIGYGYGAASAVKAFTDGSVTYEKGGIIQDQTTISTTKGIDGCVSSELKSTYQVWGGTMEGNTKGTTIRQDKGGFTYEWQKN